MTQDRVIELFGDPHPFMTASGEVSNAWPAEVLESFVLPSWIALSGAPAVRVNRVRCHHLLVEHFGAAFLDIWKFGHWPLLQDYGGCYNFRQQRGAHVLSLHSWGIALDLNVAQNPFLAPPKMPAEIVSIFKSHGFAWGGEFGQRPDGMHFEWGGGKP